MPTILIPLERHNQEVEAVKAALRTCRKVNQDNVENALEWRRKYLEADERHHEAATRIVALEQVNQHNVNVGQAADHCVGALRAELDSAKAQLLEAQRNHQVLTKLHDGHKNNAAHLGAALEEARKRADTHAKLVTDQATVNGSLRAEIHRKDKDLQLLRSELERERTRAKQERDAGASAYHRGVTDGRAQCAGDYARGLRDGLNRQYARPDISLDHRVCSGEFLHRAIDLHDLLHEIGEEDPHAVKFKVSNPAMTGSIVALSHLLRDFHNTPCQSNEG